MLLLVSNKVGTDQTRFSGALVRLEEDEVEHMEEGVRNSVRFEDLLASLPADEQEGIRVRSQELIQQELKLRDLHEAMGQTQAALAAKTGRQA